VFHSIIESIMYLGIGFLFAALIAVAVIPSIQHRTVRLTMRRLENSIPQSVEEMQAHNDLLRAEFALSTRRLEIGVEQLRERAANQFAELGRKGDVINRLKDVTNRLKIEREAQNAESFALKTEVESLKDQLASIGKEMKAAEFQRHEPGVASLVPKDWPRAEPERGPTNSVIRNEQSDDNDVVSLVLEHPTTEEARPSGPARARGLNRKRNRKGRNEN
jgi:hypothetical protein